MNCPFCHRLLYSRRRRACGHCGRELPPECVFSPEEVKAIDAELAELEASWLATKKAEAEERERRRNDSGADMFIPPIFPD